MFAQREEVVVPSPADPPAVVALGTPPSAPRGAHASDWKPPSRSSQITTAWSAGTPRQESARGEGREAGCQWRCVSAWDFSGGGSPRDPIEIKTAVAVRDAIVTPLTGPRGGQQLAELRVGPAQSVDRPAVRLPLVRVAGVGRPRPVLVQVPHSHRPVAGRGREAAAVVIECHVQDVVKVPVGEGLGGGRELERLGGRGRRDGGIHDWRKKDAMRGIKCNACR